jgi:hypothetical protein
MKTTTDVRALCTSCPPGRGEILSLDETVPGKFRVKLFNPHKDIAVTIILDEPHMRRWLEDAVAFVNTRSDK